MTKFAFDLDGVLVPDCDQIPSIGGLDEFYSLANYMIPLFNPQGAYQIITARDAEYRSVTWAWCEKYLDPLPERLHHERLQQTGSQYKADILNGDPTITHYVESDIGIVEYLKKNVVTGCEIIHFSTYLQKCFQ
jgi:hypothetical protein